jgi:hypothetical protein
MLGSQEWFVYSMLPSRSARVTGAMWRASAIWMFAGPSFLPTVAHSRASSTYPPLTATISPRAIAAFAKSPRPSIGLSFTSVFGER